MFFLFLMIVHNNPFSTYLTQNPTDGAGLNPLLQNFYMVIHPPTMYSASWGSPFRMRSAWRRSSPVISTIPGYARSAAGR